MNITKRKSATLGPVLLVLLLVSPVEAQSRLEKENPKVAGWSGGYFSSFYLLEDAPHGFEDFDSISVEYLPTQKDDEKLLHPDQQGNIAIFGKLVTNNQKSYKFRKAQLIEGGPLIKLIFMTEPVDGISYSFDGSYLRDYTEIRRGELILGYVHLVGDLVKYKNGRKVVEARLGMTPHWIE